MHVDDEPTTFEPTPLGARQRLVPRASFVAKRAQFALGSGEQPVVAAESLVIDETHAPAGESFEPTTAEWLAIARAMESSSGWVVSSETSSGWVVSSESSTVLVTASSTALPLARRRNRVVVGVLGVLALLVLGGAAIPPDVVADDVPEARLASTIEETAPSVYAFAFEDVPPIPVDEADEVEPAKPVVKRPSAKRAPAKPSAKKRKITVDASSALGGLRPRRAW